MYQLRSLMALAGLIVSVAACGDVPSAPAQQSQPAVVVEPSAPSASPSSGAATTDSPPAATATVVPTTVASPDTTATVVEASSTAKLPEVAVVLPDTTVELVRGGERRTIASPGNTTACGHITWSPDGHRLALADGIYTLGADGADAAHAPIMGSNFRWNADGTQLAWLAGVDEHLDVIRVGGPDGDEQQIVGGAHWGYTGLIEWGPDDRTVLSGPLEAAADGSGFQIVETRGRNPRWSPDGSQLAWSSVDGDGTNASTSVMIGDSTPNNVVTAGTIALSLSPGNGIPPEVERATLRWLPASSGLLLSLPRSAVGEAGGTYLVRDGSATQITPHEMCDLSPDGTQIVAWTSDNTIEIVNVADGAAVAQLGPGIAAAWRPTPSGTAPDAPLAAKSPTIAGATADANADAVRELQQRLNEQGFDAGAVDGVWASQTEQAVRAFQAAQGLAVDGVVGPRTWAALRFEAQRATREFFQQ